MAYAAGSVERALLDNDPAALGRVSRWISLAITSPRFWALRSLRADILQETLARLIESLRQQRFDPSRDFRTYVQGIARHTALQALERLQVSNLDPPNPQGGVASDPERRADCSLLARRVLEMASEECRDLIRAYFYHEQSYEEIARALDVPIGTVKSRLFRCLEAAHFCIHGVKRRGNRGLPGANKTRTEERK